MSGTTWRSHLRPPSWHVPVPNTGSVTPTRLPCAGQASTLSGRSGLVAVTATVSPTASTTVVVIEPSSTAAVNVLSLGVLAVGVPVAGPDGSGATTG